MKSKHLKMLQLFLPTFSHRECRTGTGGSDKAQPQLHPYKWAFRGQYKSPTPSIVQGTVCCYQGVSPWTYPHWSLQTSLALLSIFGGRELTHLFAFYLNLAWVKNDFSNWISTRLSSAQLAASSAPRSWEGLRHPGTNGYSPCSCRAVVRCAGKIRDTGKSGRFLVSP